MIIVVENIVCQCYTEKKDEKLRNEPITQLIKFLSVKDKASFWNSSNWNGQRYYCSKSGVFATGFLPSVLRFFKKKKVKVTLVDNRVFSEEGIISRTVGDIKIRKYQYKLAKLLLNNYIGTKKQDIHFARGILDGATNAGKDYVGLVLHEAFADNTLLITPNKQVHEKAVKFYSSVYPNEVGEIVASPYRKWDLKPFTIAIIKTLHNRITKYDNMREQIQMFNTLIVDECHLASSKTYQETLRLINATNRFFFSGTPLDHSETYKKLNVIAQSGEVIGKVSNEFLISKEHSSNIDVNIHLIKNTLSNLDYYQEYRTYIVDNKARLKKIYEICKAAKGEQVLITHELLIHGKFILQYLKDSDLTCVIDRTHGKDRGRFAKERLFNACEINILVASMIFKIGINVSTMRHLIRTEAGKSVTTTKQITGRLLRKEKGYKGKVQLYDFFDIGKYVATHSRKRIKEYQKQGFNVVFHYEHTKTGSPKRHLLA